MIRYVILAQHSIKYCKAVDKMTIYGIKKYHERTTNLKWFFSMVLYYRAKHSRCWTRFWNEIAVIDIKLEYYLFTHLNKKRKNEDILKKLKRFCKFSAKLNFLMYLFLLLLPLRKILNYIHCNVMRRKIRLSKQMPKIICSDGKD